MESVAGLELQSDPGVCGSSIIAMPSCATGKNKKNMKNLYLYKHAHMNKY